MKNSRKLLLNFLSRLLELKLVVVDRKLAGLLSSTTRKLPKFLLSLFRPFTIIKFLSQKNVRFLS